METGIRRIDQPDKAIMATLGYVRGDGGFRYEVGARARLAGGAHLSTESIFRMAAIGSLALHGQPVRCAGIVPSVTLVIATGSADPVDNDDAELIVDKLWALFRPQLVDWLTSRAASAGLRMSVSQGVEIACGRDGLYVLPDGIMQIDVRYEVAFASSFAKQSKHSPLIEPTPDPQDSLLALVESAIEKSIRSEDDVYARLPIPVRYRASGAIEAWKQVRQAAGNSGAEFSRLLVEEEIARLLGQFEGCVRTWTGKPLSAITDASGEWHAIRSVAWQAFSASEGALYEPTPAMHRLLDATYIADDVPVGMIRLPANMLCIVPDPSWWGHDGGIEAITIFRNELGAEGQRYGLLSFIAWTHHRQRQHRSTKVLQLSLADPQRTIRAFLEEIAQQEGEVGAASGVQSARKYWGQVLDYAIKMLLYLTVRDAQVVNDRAYTDAPRGFSGLGKRKRAERLAEIELLYDRHIVGPAILDVELSSGVSSDGTHREVRGHWRRPHFKMQPHGPHSSLRKLAFIGPTIVRPDRLGL
ncbi:hypothetical protein HFK83_23275 [Ralstonia pseudosolanacearum]|uniref:hypothetical protein n=1 Tax=Ralstonia pseudosolanacearum TaxID=1310165 RepID=UPI0002F9CB1F|nr:hypothetical protein [Ralstonia pseudosolanacearum]MCK4125279.1 hypothetical protein [Ralstonia pseudosolanacearum]